MRMPGRIIARGLVAATIAAFAAAPAQAMRVAEAGVPGVQCVFPPGVYGIVDSSGTLVGLLIVYPDCRMEMYRRPPGE